jgi:predicted Rossmann fold nucleotide-binding protein DprA/Smf involved in DNA uptake
MKIAIIGSRGFTDQTLFESVMKEYQPSEVISGGAIGADSFAAAWAKNHSIPLQEFLPDYKKYGRSAPIKRNDLIVDAADIVVAFWDGTSRGTKYTIDYAKKRSKPVNVVVYK